VKKDEVEVVCVGEKPPSEELMEDMAEQERRANSYEVVGAKGVISTVVKGRLKSACEKDIRRCAAEENAVAPDAQDNNRLERGFRTTWLREIVKEAMRERGHDV
jgi:hypothetical protein